MKQTNPVPIDSTHRFHLLGVSHFWGRQSQRGLHCPYPNPHDYSRNSHYDPCSCSSNCCFCYYNQATEVGAMLSKRLCQTSCTQWESGHRQQKRTSRPQWSKPRANPLSFFLLASLWEITHQIPIIPNQNNRNHQTNHTHRTHTIVQSIPARLVMSIKFPRWHFESL